MCSMPSCCWRWPCICYLKAYETEGKTCASAFTTLNSPFRARLKRVISRRCLNRATALSSTIGRTRSGEYLDHLQKALAEQGGMRYVYLPYTFDTLTGRPFTPSSFCCDKARKPGALQERARSACLSLLYALREGQIDEAQFRRQCDEYGADADKALSWYDKHRSVRATAEVHAFYEPESGSLQYVVADPARRCAIIDPVLDFDRRSGTVSHQQAKDILNFIHQRGGRARVLDTHPHADHFSAATGWRRKTGAFTGISEKLPPFRGCGKRFII